MTESTISHTRVYNRYDTLCAKVLDAGVTSERVNMLSALMREEFGLTRGELTAVLTEEHQRLAESLTVPLRNNVTRLLAEVQVLKEEGKWT